MGRLARGRGRRAGVVSYLSERTNAEGEPRFEAGILLREDTEPSKDPP